MRYPPGVNDSRPDERNPMKLSTHRLARLLLPFTFLLLLCITAPVPAADPESSPAPIDRWNALVSEKEKLDAEVSAKMGDLQKRAQSEPNREAIIAEFEALRATYIKKYESLFAEMRPLATTLDYQAHPETIPTAEELLKTCFAQNRYDEASQIADRLLAGGDESATVLAIAGRAAYANHQFARAAQLLQQAQAKQSADPQVGTFLEAANKYPELWQREQAIRQAEASAAKKNPQVLLKTPRGEILLELFEDQAPNTVANFVSLVESGFYDGTRFHRVIPGFMAQGGDPNSKDDDPRNDGSGGPGHTIECECTRPDTRMHFAGSLSMAHAGKDTGGSQFFITHLPTDHLNGRHTVFGRVVEGLPTARQLQKDDAIESATVVRKRNHPYTPKTTKRN